MSQLQWGRRRGQSITLTEAGQDVATFELADDQHSVARIAGNTWNFTLDSQSARATNGETTWTAEAPKSFRKAKQFQAQLDGRTIDFINEQRSDWILDENDVKRGQFTGANQGVRNVLVEFEPDADFDLEQRVFLAWLARIALEQRLVASTWLLTVILLILSPLVLFLFFT